MVTLDASDLVPGLGGAAGKAGKGIATGIKRLWRLLSKVGVRVTHFASKAAARKAFSGDLQKAANRFFRDATSKSENFKALDISGGGKQLEFFTPAKNAGYGKRYVQEIDNLGNIVKEFKETIGPKGIIETKWIHGGP